MFNVKEYLESKDIEYWTSGKNVTSGWTNIHCIFPGCSDPSNHLGINPAGEAYHCHVCGERGFINQLICEIEECSWDKADQIRKSFSDDAEPEERIITKNIKTKLPKCSASIPKMAKSYLRKRRFKPSTIISKYQLRYGGITGDYKYRLVIPFYLNRKLVTFSSLDITGKQNLKYKHQPMEEAIIDPSRMIYNIDSVRDKMILVEGITDVWRIGNGCCSVQGKMVSHEQISMILKYGIKQILVMFDSDAVNEGKRIASILAGIISNIEYIEYNDLWEGDPDDLPENIIKKLRKEFF